MSEHTLFCHRCGRVLNPGAGNWYEVRIEAVCDPTPPRLDDWVSQETLDEAIEEARRALEQHSDQELADQVYRRLVVALCWTCYRQWIEDPVGSDVHER